MPEKVERTLRLICFVLAACVLLEAFKIVAAKDPLKGARVPLLARLEKPPSAPPATNAPAHGPRPMPGPMMAGMPGMPGPPAPPLPPEIKARVDHIVEKELLGPVIRPLPMALLGIAGDTAFLRAANGQSGLVKVGGDVGGLKLLVIGTNRVLVEDAGKQQELTIFSGYGGESLLPAAKENSK